MKRIIALFISLVLCVGILPAQLAAAAEEGGENIALGKKVIPSSTMGGYDPLSAIDGDYKTMWVRGTLAPNEHITIDLGEAYRITSVVLHNRLDINENNYRTRVAVEFSNTPDFSVKERVVAMGDDPAPYGVGVEVAPPSKTPYRYVRAIKMDTFIFVLAEFEIYGYIPDPNAMDLGEDVAGAKQEGPISLLSYLGVMNGVNDDSFGVDHLMTRADAADSVVRVFGSNSGFSGGVPFPDVDASHPYYQSIVAAYYMGYITGDGNSSFRPDDYITKSELLFMIMRATGYAQRFGGNSALILSEALQLNLLKNVPTDELSEPISRGDAAAVLYNALLAPSFQMTTLEGETLVFEQGEDLLRRRFGVTLTEGIVEETSVTRLDGNDKKSENEVQIGSLRLRDPNQLLNALLGKRVVAAVSEDMPDTLALVWATDKNEEVVIPDSKLISTESDIRSGRLVTLEEDGRENKYSLDDDVSVIVNGAADPYWEPADFDLKSGYIRLLDNDRDGEYEVAFLEVYSLHYVASAFSDEKELTVVDSSGVSKTLQRKNLTITDANGKVQAIGKIKKDAVIKLFETENGENGKIIVYLQPVTGRIEEMSETEASIGGVKYNLSQFYRENASSSAPKAGDYVSAYVDEADEILWLEPDTEANESEWIIAFSQRVGFSKGLNPDIKFRLFNENGVWVEHMAADTVRVDGYLLKKSELQERIEETAKSGNYLYEKAFLRYKTDDQSRISAIDTTQTTDKETGISFTKMDETIVSGLYSQEASSFWNQHEMVALARNDTPTFVIPVVNNAYTTSTEYDSLYRVSTVVGIAGNRSSQTQNLEQYMPDEYGYPACFVKKEGYAEAGQGEMIPVVTSESSPFIVVEKVTTALTSEGASALKIIGRNISNQQEVSILAEDTLEMVESGPLFREKPDCLGSRNMIDSAKLLTLTDAEKAKYIHKITDIGYGDIIRYEMRTTAARAVERVYDYDSTTLPQSETSQLVWYSVNGTYPDFYIAFNRFQLGTISDVTKETFTVTTFAGKEETYMKSAVPVIWACSAQGSNRKIAEGNDMYEFMGDNYRVILYSYNATPKLAVVYEYDK